MSFPARFAIGTARFLVKNVLHGVPGVKGSGLSLLPRSSYLLGSEANICGAWRSINEAVQVCVSEAIYVEPNATRDRCIMMHTLCIAKYTLSYKKRSEREHNNDSCYISS